jgi:hypothetical protein
LAEAGRPWATRILNRLGGYSAQCQQAIGVDALVRHEAKQLAGRQAGLIDEHLEIVATRKPLTRCPRVDCGNGNAQVPGDCFERNLLLPATLKRSSKESKEIRRRGAVPHPIPSRAIGSSGSGRWDGHAGRGGLRHESNLRRGQGVGLVDEVAEGALQVQGFGGEGAGGDSSVRASARGAWGAVGGSFLPPHLPVPCALLS